MKLPIGVTRFFGKTTLFMKRYGPDILTYAGITTGVAATVTACVATTKLQPILDEAKAKLAKIGEGNRKEIAKVYVTAMKKIAKLYGVPAALQGVSIACYFYGHKTLQKQNAALAAAFLAATESLNEYRKRVAEDVGEEKELEYFSGIEKEIQEIVNDDGKKKKHVVKKGVKRPISQYARYFDEGDADHPNPNWKDNPALNKMFILSMQNQANDRLHAVGHLFLNEVYDMLGLPRSLEGCFVGWVDDGTGDGFVDFGVQDIDQWPERAEFINERTPNILLDFNVTGDILYIFKRAFGEEYAEKLRRGVA